MIEVGQKLWYQPEHNSDGNYVTVSSVGRKWASIEGKGVYGYRIDIKTLEADGGSYFRPGKCFLSKEAFDENVMLTRRWTEFQKYVSHMYGLPSHITTKEQIDTLWSIIQPAK